MRLSHLFLALSGLWFIGAIWCLFFCWELSGVTGPGARAATLLELPAIPLALCLVCLILSAFPDDLGDK